MSASGGRRLIIIQGRPATGKTTLAKKLATDLHAKLVEKDAVKEFLHDYVAIDSDFAWSQALGRVSSRALFDLTDEILSLGYVTIIENAFWADIARRELSPIITKHHIGVLELYCDLDEDVRQKRFHERIDQGKRHAVHADPNKQLVPDREKYQPLEIGDIIHIDTEMFGAHEYNALKTKVQEWIGSN